MYVVLLFRTRLGRNEQKLLEFFNREVQAFNYPPVGLLLDSVTGGGGLTEIRQKITGKNVTAQAIVNNIMEL